MNGNDIKLHFPELLVSQNLKVEIKGISIDSRIVKDGELFVATKGEYFDSHSVIDEAIKNGAVGIVLEGDRPIGKQLLKIQTNNSRQAYALISSLFFEFPSEKIKLVGITGTSGKTTTAFLLCTLFNRVGIPAGFIGTLGVGIKGRFRRMELFPPTTPDAFPLNALLSEMVREDVQFVFLEVSSHAISLDRVFGLHFAFRVLTTMGVDHLDFHETEENYLNTKVSFFANQKNVILNADSNRIELFKSVVAEAKLYGIEHGASYSASNIELTPKGSHFDLLVDNEKKVHINLSIRGLFNIYNFLAVSVIAIENGISLAQLKDFASKEIKIPGRMEVVELNGKTIVVDFAHNPIEIKEVLSFLRANKKSRLITVIGPVGGSTKEKRLEIGLISSQLSDFVFVTVDDPRKDDPEELARDAFIGISGNGKMVVDRKDAIREAVKMAHREDIVAILGRGDEEEMHFKEGTKKFSDLKIVLQALNED